MRPPSSFCYLGIAASLDAYSISSHRKTVFVVVVVVHRISRFPLEQLSKTNLIADIGPIAWAAQHPTPPHPRASFNTTDGKASHCCIMYTVRKVYWHDRCLAFRHVSWPTHCLSSFSYGPIPFQRLSQVLIWMSCLPPNSMWIPCGLMHAGRIIEMEEKTTFVYLLTYLFVPL